MAKNSIWKRTPVVVALVGAAATVIAAIVGSVLKQSETPRTQTPTTPPTPIHLSGGPSLYDGRGAVVNLKGADAYPDADTRDEQEYVALLKIRASNITAQLDSMKALEDKAKFIQLHERHIEAIQKKQRIVAHELLREIQILLTPYSSDMFYFNGAAPDSIKIQK